MEYYLLLPNDTLSTITDSNMLGEDSGFGKFWAGPAFAALETIINNHADLAEHIRIIKSDKSEISIGRFFDRIAQLKLKIN